MSNVSESDEQKADVVVPTLKVTVYDPQMEAGKLIEEKIIIDRATEVIGDREKALRWFGTPVRALKYATPISLLGSEEGQQAVLTVLGRLEHGVF